MAKVRLDETITVKKAKGQARKSLWRRFLKNIAQLNRRWNRIRVVPENLGRVEINGDDQVDIIINAQEFESSIETPFLGSYDSSTNIATIGADRGTSGYKFSDTIYYFNFASLDVTGKPRSLVKSSSETVSANNGDFVYYELSPENSSGVNEVTATLRASATNPAVSPNFDADEWQPNIHMLGKIVDDAWVQFQYGDIYMRYVPQWCVVTYDSVASEFSIRLNMMLNVTESFGGPGSPYHTPDCGVSVQQTILKFDNPVSATNVQIGMVREIDIDNRGSGLRWVGSGTPADANTTTREYHSSNDTVFCLLGTVQLLPGGSYRLTDRPSNSDYHGQVSATRTDHTYFDWDQSTGNLNFKTANHAGYWSGTTVSVSPPSNASTTIYRAADYGQPWTLSTSALSHDITVEIATITLDASGRITNFVDQHREEGQLIFPTAGRTTTVTLAGVTQLIFTDGILTGTI